jgi:hypothetical protein
MHTCIRTAFFSLTCLLLTIPSGLFGQWTSDTQQNTPVDAASNSDTPLVGTTSDGSTMVSYYKNENNNYNMRLQRLNSQGVKQLGPVGVLVDSLPSGTATYLYDMKVDNKDNAVIGFQDMRNGSMQAVAYKVSPAGVKLWGADGVVLGDGLAPYIGILPNNDAVIAWNADPGVIKIQRIDDAGNSVWLNTVTYADPGGKHLSFPRVVPLSANGEFILIYKKAGNGSPLYSTVYAQKFKNDGTTAWANPVQLTAAVVLNVHETSFVNDGNDGVFCSYSGALSSPSASEVIIQYIQPDGSLPWGATGRKFSTTANVLEFDNTIRFDPAGTKVWVAVTKTNSSQSASGIYVQAFDPQGNRLLGNDAKELIPMSPDLYRFTGMELMEGTPAIVYTDNTSNHLNALHTKVDGSLIWPLPGVVLNDRAEAKSRPGLGAYKNNQLVYVWMDSRGGSNGVYAQNFTKNGVIGPVVATGEAVQDRFGLQILPNPASGNSVNLKFETTGSQALNLEVFDLSGALAHREILSTTGGLQSVLLDISGLQPGNWVVKLSNEQGASVRKLSIVR